MNGASKSKDVPEEKSKCPCVSLEVIESSDLVFLLFPDQFQSLKLLRGHVERCADVSSPLSRVLDDELGSFLVKEEVSEFYKIVLSVVYASYFNISVSHFLVMAI